MSTLRARMSKGLRSATVTLPDDVADDLLDAIDAELAPPNQAESSGGTPPSGHLSAALVRPAGPLAEDLEGAMRCRPARLWGAPAQPSRERRIGSPPS